MQIRALPLKEGMRGYGEEDVEIARRPRTSAGFALTGQPDAGAVLDACRNVDRKRAFTGNPPRPGT